MTIQPRHLILKLVLGADDETLSARAAIACCALFDIQENNVRVALNRLAASGLIESLERGRYRLGPKAAALAGVRATQEFDEVLEDGKTYQVQYFERARFERHPENGLEYYVLLGQFGRQVLAGR